MSLCFDVFFFFHALICAECAVCHPARHQQGLPLIRQTWLGHYTAVLIQKFYNFFCVRPQAHACRGNQKPQSLEQLLCNSFSRTFSPRTTDQSWVWQICLKKDATYIDKINEFIAPPTFIKTFLEKKCSYLVHRPQITNLLSLVLKLDVNQERPQKTFFAAFP